MRAFQSAVDLDQTVVFELFSCEGGAQADQETRVAVRRKGNLRVMLSGFCSVKGRTRKKEKRKVRQQSEEAKVPGCIDK